MSGPPFLCQDPTPPISLYIRTQVALTQDHFVCQDVLELGAAVKRADDLLSRMSLLLKLALTNIIEIQIKSGNEQNNRKSR